MHAEQRPREECLNSGSARTVKGPSKISSGELRTVRTAFRYYEAIKLESLSCGDLWIGCDRPECDVHRASWDAPFHVSREPLWGQLQTPGATATEALISAALCREHLLRT